MAKARKHELIVYGVLWAVAFLAPLITHYVQALHSEDDMDWMFLRRTWMEELLFMAIFWAHDLFAMPHLFKRNGLKAYLLRFAVLLLLLLTVQVGTFNERRPPNEGLMPPNMGPHAGNPPPRPHPASPEVFVRIMLGLMMYGANIGIRFYFKSQQDEAENMEREKQNLNKELEFLTYQISPHFFMNTLNNIYALIDIDKEKAKNTVIELSRMMRFALYDGGAEAVPLQKELDFLNHYITLMRLRYTDNVDIKTNFNCAAEGIMVPPLLLVTFVENAFKHGVSYRSASYIHISVSTDKDKLTFSCRNSVPHKPISKHTGIGLENVKKRLRLIYRQGFELIINRTKDTFSVLLTIPTSHDKMYSNG